jgi:glycosyltransferase involved in cell wall biosynthesis
MAGRPDCSARVLYLQWSGRMGGGERHVFDLATALPPEGYDPVVCFMSAGSTYGRLLAEAGVKTVEMRLRSGYDIAGALRFARWLGRNSFDIVHDQMSTPWARMLVKLVAPGSACLYTEHTLEYRRMQRWWQRVSVGCTDRYIVVSNATKSVFAASTGVKPDRIEVVPNFVDARRFPPLSNEQKSQYRRAFGVPVEAMVLASVGRLDENKNFATLIKVLAPFMIERKELYLVIAGEGSLYESLLAQIRELGLQNRIRLLGQCHDVPKLLGMADLFVFASLVETFGIVAVEAMMAGIPVVALDIAGLREQVDCGRTGILVSQSSLWQEFPAAVASLIDNPALRQDMGQAGRKRAMALYDRRVVVRRIVGLYDDLLNSTGVGDRHAAIG